MYSNKIRHFFHIVFLIFGKSSSAEGKSEEFYAEFALAERIVACPPWEDGVPTYHPYPYDCRKFIECTNGYAIEHSCPPLTVWDQDLLTCNHEASTPCVIVTTEGPPELTSPETEETTTMTPPVPGPIEGGGIYTIVYPPEGMAFRVRKPNIFNGMNIDGMPHVPDCSDLYQVWKLEYNSTTGFYMIRSALETGSNQWTLRLSAIANRPRIYQYPGEPWASSIWKLDAVPGTELYTIYQPNPHLGGNVRYTGWGWVQIVIEPIRVHGHSIIPK